MNDWARKAREERDRAAKEAERRLLQARDDARRDAERLAAEAAEQARRARSDLLNDAQKALDAAGKAIEKPFRDAGNNVKEAIFFAARDHVASKNAEYSRPGKRFGPWSRYCYFIQPHLPEGMEFSEIEWFFDAYVPQDMAGITFGDTVYIDPKFPEEFDEGMLQLMAHETGHVLQYRRLNTKGFARKYMDDIFGSFMRVPSFDQVKIHDDLDLEKEADAFAEKVMRAYAQKVAEDSRKTDDGRSRLSGNTSGPRDVPPVTPQMSEGERIALTIIKALQAASEQNRQREREGRPGPRNRVGGQPRLGVNVQPIPGRGARVTSVTGGMPGAAAGIEVDDIIVAIDDQRVESAEDVLDALRNAAAEGRRSVLVLVENQRLRNRPIEERFAQVEVEW